MLKIVAHWVPSGAHVNWYGKWRSRGTQCPGYSSATLSPGVEIWRLGPPGWGLDVSLTASLCKNKFVKNRLKLSRCTPRRRLGERRYSSSFSTSALDGGEWSASRPGRALPPVKGPPVPIVQEAGWAPEPVWTQRLEEKSFCPCRGSNPDRPVVQPVVRHYSA
jgi:hypothetical protein